MGDLAQEMWDMAQHNFEACCRLDKRLGNNYSAYRYAEQRIAELEAVLKATAPKLNRMVRMPNTEWVADEHNAAVEKLKALLGGGG